MPMHSTNDADMIREWMRRGKLFCKIDDNIARQMIEKRTLECRRIVTLKSFIEDSRLLKACADGLYQLLPRNKRGKQSLRRHLQACFQHKGKSFHKSYVNLCCHAVRDFKYLSQGKFSQPRKDKGHPTPDVQPRDYQKLGSLAYLAASLGFKSQEIDELIAQARKPLVSESAPAKVPKLSSDYPDIPNDSRSNRPGNKSYIEECKYLFAEIIIQESGKPCKAHPTSFAVIRDTFLRFWADCVSIEQGDPELGERDDQSRQISHSRDPIQDVQEDREMSIAPGSSIYDESTSTASQAYFTRPKSCGREQFGSELDYEDLCDEPHGEEVLETRYEDDSHSNLVNGDSLPICVSTYDETHLQTMTQHVQRPTQQGSGTNMHGNALLTPNESSLTVIDPEALGTSSQAEQSQTTQVEIEARKLGQVPPEPKPYRDQLEQINDKANRSKKQARQQEEQFRITKRTHQSQTAMMKQEKDSVRRAWQNRGDGLRQKIRQTSQAGLVVRSEREHPETEDVTFFEIDRHKVPQSRKDDDETNSALPYGDYLSRVGGSDEGTSVMPTSEFVIPRLKQGDDGQPLQTQDLSNEVLGGDEGFDTRQSESRENRQKKTLTRQQVRDGALQRRKKKIEIRSQLVQEQKVGEGLTVVHEHVNQTMHRQAQQGDVEQPDVEQPDVDQYMQRDIYQWYAHDGEDDVQCGKREAEEHVRNAADAAGEVYDDILLGNEQEEEEDGNENDITVHDPRNTTTSLFPGGLIEPQADSSEGDHILSGAIGSQMSSEIHTGTRDRSTSRRDIKKPVYKNEAFLEYVAARPLLGIEAPRSYGREPERVHVNSDTNQQINRPKSHSPGPSFNPEEPRQVTVDVRSQAAQAHYITRGSPRVNGKHSYVPLPKLPVQTGNSELSRRRKFVDETEETNIRIRTPQNHNPAQLKDFESVKDEVASVELIWNELEDNKIYVMSTVDIEELASRRHPKHKRLWSWSKDEEDAFDSQIGLLLRRGFHLQVITSNQDTIQREYRSVLHMDYWKVYFTNRSLYWLAILSPEPAGSKSRKKVQRIEEYS